MGQIVLYIDRGDKVFINKLTTQEHDDLVRQLELLDGASNKGLYYDVETDSDVLYLESPHVEGIEEYFLIVNYTISNENYPLLKTKIKSFELQPRKRYKPRNMKIVEYINVESMLIK